ncbi:hypothetical protein [Nocardioides sp. SYSU D00038]|uniref:hypothetical protein n=1 Tax=Nocardioides sp. SYSU D00038 TaxID=2812554 RepID=UPI001967A0B6|nr:hypothetical protein [Nocardioides sp. SYSU D00038]
MSAVEAASPQIHAPSLRRLYLVRFGFAVVWAALFAATSSPLGAFTFGLAVLYPAFDLAAAVVDARSSTSGRPTPALYVNMVLSLAAAVAIAVAGKDDLQAILVIWGLWAVTAGLVQLAVGVLRRSLGGQWPMILSGGISVLAGGSFIAMAGSATSLTAIAGYATLGGIFFLASAIRLGRTARTAQSAEVA